jgi:hypothetical protein
MTRDLCTSGDNANFTVCTKTSKWEAASTFYRFQDDSVKWTLWGSQFESIESTCIDNKLEFSLSMLDFIVSSVHVMMCNKFLILMHELDKYNIHTFFFSK